MSTRFQGTARTAANMPAPAGAECAECANQGDREPATHEELLARFARMQADFEKERKQHEDVKKQLEVTQKQAAENEDLKKQAERRADRERQQRENVQKQLEVERQQREDLQKQLADERAKVCVRGEGGG